MGTNILKNWSIQKTWDGCHVLIGRLYNDDKERYDDGTEIRTSALRSIDFVMGVAYTDHTRYILVTGD